MHFTAERKSRKKFGFVIYSYFKDNAFTAVNGMQSSKGKYLDHGAEPHGKKFC